MVWRSLPTEADFWTLLHREKPSEPAVNLFWVRIQFVEHALQFLKFLPGLPELCPPPSSVGSRKDL